MEILYTFTLGIDIIVVFCFKYFFLLEKALVKAKFLEDRNVFFYFSKLLIDHGFSHTAQSVLIVNVESHLSYNRIGRLCIADNRCGRHICLKRAFVMIDHADHLKI